MINQNEQEIYQDYRICPKCGSKVLTGHDFCTKCGTRMVENASGNGQSNVPEHNQSKETYNGNNILQQDTGKKKSFKTALIIVSIVMTISIIANIVEAYYINQNSITISSLQSENASLERKNSSLSNEVTKYKTKASKYDEICTFLQSSDAGYGSNNYYSNTKIVVLKKNSGKSNITITSKNDNGKYIHCQVDNNCVECEWSSSWNNNSTKLYITPKASGISKITFTKDANNSKFRVMVIVVD